MSKLTLEDKLAISMPSDKIPVIENEDALQEALKILGIDIEWEEATLQEQLIFSFRWQAYCRYSYAESMIKYRP